MGWATVPITTVVAFTFMGIEGIADEIEMPFGLSFLVLLTSCLQRISLAGTDDRDLPLGQIFISSSTISKLTFHTDRYCQDLKEEIECVFNLRFKPPLLTYVKVISSRDCQRVGRALTDTMMARVMIDLEELSFCFPGRPDLFPNMVVMLTMQSYSIVMISLLSTLLELR